MNRIPIISPDEFRDLARPVSIHVDDEEIEQFSREVEDIHIIPAFGWQLLKSVVKDGPWSDIFDDGFSPKVFLIGGEYSADACGCDGSLKFCNGLKKCIAYYVYAKMLRNDGNIIARAGAMQHNDQYAYHTDEASLKRYNDAMDVAEHYLAECMDYANQFRKNRLTAAGTRCRIKAIGD